MIRINLIPAEETERAAGRRRDLAVGTIALSVLAVAFVLAHVWQGVQLRMANRQLEWLTAELKKIEGDYADVTKIEQQKTELREKLRVIAQLEAKKVGPVRILADLAAATPDKLWLTEFSDTAGALKLTGLGVDDHTVADFLRRLGALPFFHGVDLDETSQVDQDGAKLKKFVIHGQVDYAAGQGTTQAAAAGGGKP
ncbi:MAG TPA: PilN domain-containing protein [Candidatus Binatia bacterium]|jgi:type IV pilus assembly protein PilN|nr:PilN domain-containing protein [Candidatus Binatia bacterium]